jgi:hypothetical protein
MGRVINYNDTFFRSLFPAYANTVTYPAVMVQIFWDTATAYVSNRQGGCYVGGLMPAQQTLALNQMTAHLLYLNGQIAAGTTPGVMTSLYHISHSYYSEVVQRRRMCVHLSLRNRYEVRMIDTWAREEAAEADLKDARLDERFAQVLSDLGRQPNASIPQACGGRAELVAAYRFFDNDKTNYDNIHHAHTHATIERVRGQTTVVCSQDTTEIELTRPQQQVKDVGPLDNGARRGLFLHRLDAFTTDGTPLGRIWSKVWTRPDPPDEPLTAPQKNLKRKTSPIEQKESFRWLEGLRHVRVLAQQCPEVRCVCVADSEADIYELFVEDRGSVNPIQFVVRLCQERSLLTDAEQPTQRIRDAVEKTPVLFERSISIRAREPKVACEDRVRRQGRAARQAQMVVRAVSVTLDPPYRPDRKLTPVTVNVVQVREINPPAGEEPVEWLVVTSLPIADADAVRVVIAFYTVRWMSEVFFRTLKSGCRVEQRLFEERERLEVCLAVYEIIAWRTLFVCRLGRSCPDLSCEAVFEPCEWKAVWTVIHQKKPPKKAPPLPEMVRLIAQLGGYVNRPNRDDPPGPQTVSRGLQRMYDLALAWNTFGSKYQ